MPRTTEAATRVAISSLVILFTVLAAFGGCSPAGPPSIPCVTDDSATCKPTYDPPTFDAIYKNILHPTCAAGTGTCHTSDARKAGLVFADEDQSYALLLGQNGAPVRVTPGDVSCSLIMKRTKSTDPNFHMPPGNSLSAGDLCTIEKWIAGGAKR